MLEAGVTYLDMAMTLSEPHPTKPHEEVGSSSATTSSSAHRPGRNVACSHSWGSGSSPARRTSSPGTPPTSSSRRSTRSESATANLVVDGYDFAPTFSIWTTIEECLNPPVIWERGRGWFTTAPFSEPELFDFPEGIGPVECVNVEHEELLVPRWIDCERVTFKYGLGDEFIEVLKACASSASTRRRRSREGRRRRAARRRRGRASDPATLGERMTGRRAPERS